MTAQLEQRLGHTFLDRSLLETALTHSSYANESRGQGGVCNERLEFLGDSVLGVTVADFLYRHYGSMPEGRMTRLRSELVCEEHNGGRERPSILSDALEALIAALYLDGGMGAASKFIHTWLLSELDGVEPVAFTDFKTALQELVQRRSGQTLSYELIDEQGPDHAKIFTVRVLLNGDAVGRGDGKT